MEVVFTDTHDTLLDGRYLILRRLGQGAFGEVFLTRHVGLGVYRAVKRIRKSKDVHNTRRKEADALKNLRHTSLPIIYDIDEDDVYFYIVEEYIEGISLSEYVRDRTRLAQDETCSVIMSICTVLSYMQTQAGLLHLDIKPDNVLLTEDGVIFISIGDDENANLIKICDEVFGEHNFIADICHKHRASVSNDRIISENHNHIAFYAKEINEVFAQQKNIGEDPVLDGFDREDDKGKYKLAPVDGPGGAKKGNPFYEFMGVEGYWRYSKETMQKLYDNGLLIVTENNLQKKYYEEQARQSRKKVTTWWDTDFLTSSATSYLQKLMGCKAFDNPKSINLLIRMLKMMTHFDKDALILDFFSGSATTAHAVMQLNAEDGGNRRYICVQLPEETPEDSEARKAGYATIPEIAKERIRRSGAKIKADSPLTTQNLDTGFRVYRLDESNYEKVSLSPKEYKQDQLDLFAYNIKRDRTDLDLLYGSMLAWGVRLDLPLQAETMDGCTIYTVNEGDLVACFSEGITDKVVTAMADKSPLRVLFRDACFKEDAQKINIYEQFKQFLDWSDNDAFNNIRVI